MTTAEQLREAVRYLQARIRLAPNDEREILFDPPTPEAMIGDGLDETTVRVLVSASWWQEMVDDVRETFDFAGPGESPKVVLGYARDVVEEYTRKRFQLEA